MVWAALIITLLFVLLTWRYPRYLVVFLLVGLPLEISKTWYPHIPLLNRLGEFVGIIDLGRIATLAVLVYVAWERLVGRKRIWDEYSVKSAWNKPLFIISAVYILIGLVSFTWSTDHVKPLVATIRYLVLCLTGVAVFRLTLKYRDEWSIPLTLSIMGTITALIGVVEGLTHRYIWLGEVYANIHRVNSTFIDANIFARFLIIGGLATGVWMFGTGRGGKLVGALCLLIQGLALLYTGSRFGWLALVVVILLYIGFVPRKAVVLFLGGGLVLAGLGIALNPALLSRVLELKQGLGTVSSERVYLLQAGWEMFKSRPMLGVGLGNFQTMMLTNYAHWIQNNVSLSHTALMTTASELGILGLGITTVFLACLYGQIPGILRKLRFPAGDFQASAQLHLFAILALTAIFISAQGEGRFWEDPFLWILVGYMSALRDLEGVS